MPTFRILPFFGAALIAPPIFVQAAPIQASATLTTSEVTTPEMTDGDCCQPPSRATAVSAKPISTPSEGSLIEKEEIVASTAAALPSDVRAQIEDAVSKVYPALARIEIVVSEPGEGRLQRLRGFGSGTIIDKEGHILTNHHVAGHAVAIRVTLSDRRVIDATLVGTDALSDLAVIKLDLEQLRPNEVLPVAEFGDSSTLTVGDLVMAMGSPAGLSQSVTVGVVANTEMISPQSNSGLRLDGEDVGELVRWIGHDAIIAGGNSGGPLVNSQGLIVGVNEVGISSIGGAIPANLAQKVAKELIEKGSVSRSDIGVEIQQLLRSDDELEKGALVASVIEGQPANQAGIQTGDILTAINGETVPPARAREDIPVFNRMVLESPVGTTLEIDGFRGETPMHWSVITTERHPAESTPTELDDWGMLVSNITPNMARSANITETEGALIHSLRPGRAGASAKPALDKGDVIIQVADKEILDAEALTQWTEDFTEELTAPAPVLVRFNRGEQEMVSLVEVGPEVESIPARSASNAWFGAAVQAVTDELSDALGYENEHGVMITKIGATSPAAAAGLLAGDYIVRIDGRKLNIRREEDSAEFAAIIRQYRSGDEMPINIIRGDEEKEIIVTLGATPPPANEQPFLVVEGLEFTVRATTNIEQAEEEERLTEKQENTEPSAHTETSTSPAGLVVSEVENGGWANLSGLTPGDLILNLDDKPVNALQDVELAITEARDANRPTIVLFVRRGMGTRFIEINNPWHLSAAEAAAEAAAKAAL